MEHLLTHKEIFQLIPTPLYHHYNLEPEICIAKDNTYSIRKRKYLKNDVFMFNYATYYGFIWNKLKQILQIFQPKSLSITQSYRLYNSINRSRKYRLC